MVFWWSYHRVCPRCGRRSFGKVLKGSVDKGPQTASKYRVDHCRRCNLYRVESRGAYKDLSSDNWREEAQAFGKAFAGDFPGSLVNTSIKAGDYRNAFAQAKTGWAPDADSRKWPESMLVVRSEQLLAAAYLVEDVEWCLIALKAIQDGRDFGLLTKLARDVTPEVFGSLFTSWRFCRLAAFCLHLHRREEIGALRRALALEQNPTTYLSLSGVLSWISSEGRRDEQGEEEACELVAEAHRRFPDDIETSLSLCWQLLDRGQPAEAEGIADGIDVIQIRSRHGLDSDNDAKYDKYPRAEFLALRARIKHALGKDREALSLYEKAITIQPDFFAPQRDMPYEDLQLYEKLKCRFG